MKSNFTVKYDHKSIIFAKANDIELIKKKKRKEVVKGIPPAGTQTLFSFSQSKSKSWVQFSNLQAPEKQKGPTFENGAIKRRLPKKPKVPLFHKALEVEEKKINHKGPKAPKRVQIKSAIMKDSQDVYSQSSQSGKTFDKTCSRGVFFAGPSQQHKRNTNDFDQFMREQNDEIQRQKDDNFKFFQPKFVVWSENITQRFEEFSVNMHKFYSKQYKKVENIKNIKLFIESEIARISIIYFNNLPDVSVELSKSHQNLVKNLKKVKLLNEKYNENYISDLIDSAKTQLKGYLSNFMGEAFCDKAFYDSLANEDKINFIQDQTKNNTKRSHRLLEKSFDSFFESMSKFKGVFMSDEFYKSEATPVARRLTKQELDESVMSKYQSPEFWDDSLEPINLMKAVGNTSEQIIKTCCEELGFKFIMINSVSMKRSHANLAKYFLEGTQSHRMNLPSHNTDHKPTKTVIFLEDIDNIFPDEAGFHTAVTKWIEGSKVPIIMCSHKSFAESEVIKRWEKKGMQIKEIARDHTEMSALKLLVRLHIIVTFEFMINAKMQEYFETQKDNDEKNNELPVDVINFSSEFQEQIIEKYHQTLSILMQKFDYNLKKVLSMLSFHHWDLVDTDLEHFWLPPWIKTSRDNLLIHEDLLFSSDHPNEKLTNVMFDEVLVENVNWTAEIENDDSMTTKSSPEHNPLQYMKTDESNSLEKYTEYISNLSEFWSLEQRMHNFTESITSKNIWDINIWTTVDKERTQSIDAIDDYLLNAPAGYSSNLSLMKDKIKRWQSNLYDYSDHLTTIGGYSMGGPKKADSSTNHTFLPRMTMEGMDERNEKIPYFCWISKDDNILQYKRKLNSTHSLYQLYSEGKFFHEVNVNRFVRKQKVETKIEPDQFFW